MGTIYYFFDFIETGCDGSSDLYIFFIRTYTYLNTYLIIFLQVQMQMNRLPLCEMHQAVDKLSDVKLVFPSLTEKPSIPWNPLK